jgi:hypothetical protein
MTVQEARRLLEAELSHNEIHDALRSALKERHPNARLWLADVYDDHVIYKVEPKGGEDDPPEPTRFYQATYAVDDGGAVTLGDSVEVERVITYEPVASATAEGRGAPLLGTIVPLREAKGTSFKLKLIEPGWGSSGYWPAEVLERDGPAAFPAGTHQYLDHPTASEEAERPERSVKDLAAVLATDAAWDADGWDGPGLYAETVVVDQFVDVIGAIADDIGASVNTWAVTEVGEAEGKRGPIVKRLASADEAPFNSVDFVTKAGAGGEIKALMESARTKVTTPTPGDAPQHEGASTAATASAPKEADEMDEKLKEQLEAAVREANELRTENEGLKAERAQLRERLAIGQATAVVAGRLAETELPTVTQSRLTETLSTAVKLTEAGELDQTALSAAVEAAVADETAYLAELTESGKVRDQGGSTASDGALEKSFEARYLSEGMSPEQAKQMAARAASGR